MKAKILTVLALLLGTFTNSFSQQQGTQCVGVSTGFSYTSNSNSDEIPNVFAIQCTPEFDYYLANNFKIGFGVSFAHQKQPISGEGTLKTTILGIGPTLGFTIPLGEKVFYTPEISMAYAFAKNTLDSNSPYAITNETQELTGFAFAIIPFLMEIRPKETFGIAISLVSISSVKLKEDSSNNPDETKQLTFNIGLNPSVGFRFYF